MANKKTKFLFLICLITLSAVLGLGFYSCKFTQSYASTGALVSSYNEIFTNYTETELKNEYNNKNIIENMRMQNQISEADYVRALDVINGNIKYSALCEFSTNNDGQNSITQAGDVIKYAKSSLRLNWEPSEFILTGIYGLTGQTIKIFVQAEHEDKLPKIVFTQNHGYYPTYEWQAQKSLQIGLNEFEYTDFSFRSSKLADDEVKGGAIYLTNPYTKQEQGEVNIYIEGGGYYPIYKKGSNEAQFLGTLKEYETQRRANTSTYLDMAELVTDHAVFTTTSSSLYDVYIKENEIAPQKNVELWADYMNTAFGFYGIENDPKNDNVIINFRYMTYYQNSGAYSYFYHIGFYYEHYWFANFTAAAKHAHGLSDHLIFGMGHELGHMLDVSDNAINETTNNFCAALLFFKVVKMPHVEQYQPFTKTFDALCNDFALNIDAFDDGQIMYTKLSYLTNYDHNYMIWWDIEAVYPGFWAKLSNYYRNPPATINLSKEEKYVYYSSLATGVNLTSYYERWGFFAYKPSNSKKFAFADSSQEFKSAMQAAEKDGKISNQFDHFWYVDAAQYDFSIAHQNVPENARNYIGGTPSITRIEQSNEGNKICISSNKSDTHLGYEVLVKVDGQWKVAGFTYTSIFVDKNEYKTSPTYKAIAVNRYFKISLASEEYSKIETGNANVCQINGTGYPTLLSAMIDAHDGDTIYLLSDCNFNSFTNYSKNITIAVDPSINNNICIYSNKSYLQLNKGLKLMGNARANIVVEGNFLDATNPVIYLSGGKFEADYVVFQNLKAKSSSASVIYGLGGDVKIYNSTFKNCSHSKASPVVYCAKNAEMSNVKFTDCDDTNIMLKDISNLTLANTINEFTLAFENDFTDEKTIATSKNFMVEELKKIMLVKPGYMLNFDDGLKVKPLAFNLQFNDGSTNFEYVTNSSIFTFGQEKNYNLLPNQYVKYVNKATNKEYITGDNIEVNSDISFTTEIKNKLALHIYFDGQDFNEFFPEGYEFYLPTQDGTKNKIVAYLDGQNTYYAGQVCILNSNTTLTAKYVGKFACRFFVDDNLYNVTFGSYNENINLLNLDKEGFAGWKTNDNFYTTNMNLTGDVDLFAFYEGEIKLFNLNNAQIELKNNTFTFTGQAIMPNVVVKINNSVIAEECYKIEYSNNVYPSHMAQIRLVAVSGFSYGSQTIYFTIVPKNLIKTDVSIEGLTDFVFNGSPTTQNLNIYYNGAKLIENTDYTIAYIGNRTNAGVVQIKIEFMGNYTGSFNVNYTIEKAEKPTVNTTIHIPQMVQRLIDIELPKNFKWSGVFKTVSANKILAKAIYVGEDAANYKTTEIEFEIIIDQPKTTNINWLMFVIPGFIVLAIVVGFIIARRRQNR